VVMSCVCCIELILWHPSGPGKLCLTLRSGHRYRSSPPMPVRMKKRCVLSVDVMAGLTTTLKVAMFRLRCREPTDQPAGGISCVDCTAKTNLTHSAGIATWLRVASVRTDYFSCARRPSLRRFRPHHDTGCC
jgi:hypothetical protein